MFEKTNLVSKIFYINIIAFIFTLAIPNLMFLFAVYPINSNEFSIYRFITYMFIHSGFTHLIFNMVGFLSFGPLW